MEQKPTKIFEDKRWTQHSIRLRAIYQRTRNVLEKAMKDIATYSELYPPLFDQNTEEGSRRADEVLEMIEDEDYDSLKAFVSHWKPIIIERQRKQRRSTSKEPKAL